MSTFDDFWAVYPRRVAKLAAQKAFAKALKIASADDIIAGAKRYAAERANEDQQFTAHPASWLNAGRWMDEPKAPAPLKGAAAIRDRIRREIEDGQARTIGPRGESDDSFVGLPLLSFRHH